MRLRSAVLSNGARLFWVGRVGFKRAPAMREIRETFLVPGKMCLLVVDRLPIVPTESFFPILPVFGKIPTATAGRLVKPG